MKFSELKPVINEYFEKKEKEHYRQKWFFQSKKWDSSKQEMSAGIKRLVTLYDAEDKKDKVIPDVVLRNFLDFHWKEIRSTSASYLQNIKVSATEQAYLRLASLVDASSDAQLKPSHVRIATLMPGVRSFAKTFHVSQPVVIIQNQIFQYETFLEELKERVSIENFTLLSDALDNYDLHAAKDLCEALEKVEPRKNNQEQQEFKKIKTVFAQLVELLTLRENQKIKNANQAHTARKLEEVIQQLILQKPPSRYSFKVENNEFDLRCLFFTKFRNPITGQSFSESDREKLLKHPVMGTLIDQFQWLEDYFVLVPSEEQEKEINVNSASLLSFSQNTDGIKPLSRRQQYYARLSGLLELSDHLCFDKFLDFFPNDIELKKSFETFRFYATPLRARIIWGEMDNAEFFEKARPVIDMMKTEMSRDWDPSTIYFFQAIKEFSEDPETVVKSAKGGNIVSTDNSKYGNEYEYVVRVPSIAKDADAVRVLKEIVGQFRRCFEMAYRDDCLRALMQGMTPHGICIAEKMLHLSQSFAVRASLGAVPLDDVFADVMAKARKCEISRGGLWGGNDFLRYLLSNHAGRTSYVDEQGKKQFLQEKVIRGYLIDVMSYEDVQPYIESSAEASSSSSSASSSRPWVSKTF